MFLTRSKGGRISVSVALMAVTLGCAMARSQVRTASGMVEGVTSADSQIRAFKGIPYAAPPVGKLRWQPPQPAASWQGVRKATAFGARCMQGRIFDDMVFRDDGPSEDCLTLNVWTPATSESAKLPVMVWIYGGGFQGGAASEPRQDGEHLARKGVVVVSMNYRLGIFGFFSHPELSAESPHHASGNYGFLDQAAAIAWVHTNIAAFGGDSSNVTIFGESAGSMSVSAQMASPLSKDLVKRAIGESGSVFMLTRPLPSLSQTEQSGAKFGQSLGAASLQSLRAKPAAELLAAVLKGHSFDFWPNIDGYFFPENPSETYTSGKQAHIPLLAGWNTDEQGYEGFFGKQSPTLENYRAKIREQYPSHANELLKLYPAGTEAEMKDSARDLAGDQFIAYSTWKWIDMQLETGGSPVYRYHFEQAPPQPAGKPSHGAYHSADIEYVFQTLDSKNLPWNADDRKLSDLISSYWTNLAKAGDPNGSGLPQWPAYTKAGGYEVMHLKVGAAAEPHAAADATRPRYEQLDAIAHQAAKTPAKP